MSTTDSTTPHIKIISKDIEFGILVPISRKFLEEELEFPIDTSAIGDDDLQVLLEDLEFDALHSSDDPERQTDYFWERLEPILLENGAFYIED